MHNCSDNIIYLLLDCSVEAVFFSDYVTEVPADQFHSSPKHKGHPHLKARSLQLMLHLFLTKLLISKTTNH